MRTFSIGLRLALVAVAIPSAGAQELLRPNFTMEHRVTLTKDPSQPAQIHTILKGANEIDRIRWRIPEHRFDNLAASGNFVQTGPEEWTWTPGAIDGEVRYQAPLFKQRGGKGYDSYHGGSWILLRTSDLFPRKTYVTRRPLRGLTRVRFQLPAGWEAVSAMQPIGPNYFQARPRFGDLTKPYGWLLIGELAVHRFTIADVAVTIATPRAAQFDPATFAPLLRRSLRRLQHIIGRLPPELTVVIGSDPMWRGGISGEHSLYLNQELAVISKDYTSTIIHELFHVVQGFRKSSTQADWIVEGLAEYYSLRILRDLKIITRNQFRRGIRTFEQQGQWNVDLTKTRSRAAKYNSAPLVFFYLDQLLQTHTQGKKSLATIVTLLGRHHEVSNLTLKQALEKAAPDLDHTAFFQRYVYQGHKPPYRNFLDR